MNDYMGMLLHQARVDDFVKDAERGKLIRARSAPNDRRPGVTGRKVASRLLWAIFVATIAALRVTQG